MCIIVFSNYKVTLGLFKIQLLSPTLPARPISVAIPISNSILKYSIDLKKDPYAQARSQFFYPILWSNFFADKNKK